jgi:SM-20-related protein
VPKVEKFNQSSGGHVVFEYLKNEIGQPYTVVPRKGLFVAFPSTPLFSHSVSEVTDGYRISIVEWYDAELLKP